MVHSASYCTNCKIGVKNYVAECFVSVFKCILPPSKGRNKKKITCCFYWLMLTTMTTEQKKQPPENTLSETELRDASNLFKIFLQAWKNYSLYPEGHTISTKSLESLVAAFANFFSKHGDLDLVVEKQRLLWQNTAVHEVTARDYAEDIVFLLYRDGISWIEFLQGLPIDELTSFFKILKKYKSIQEESEGDIVTDLIDGDFAYIEFKARDVLWQDYPLLDFSELQAGQDSSEIGAEGAEQQGNEEHADLSARGSKEPSFSDALREASAGGASAGETDQKSSQVEPEETEQQKSSEHADISTKSITDPSFSDALWEISPAEHEKLQKMIQKEENWDNPEDVFDVLMVILQSQTDSDNFSSTLDFTLEEVIETIEQGEFDQLLKLFQSLRQLQYKDTPEAPTWMRPLIERFFQDLSKPEIFNSICPPLLALHDNDANKIATLQQVLLYFSPDVIFSIGQIIPQIRSQKVYNMILEVIENLCLKNMKPLEEILQHADSAVADNLLPVLIKLKGERATKIFLLMTKHPSAKVRAQAIKILLTKDPKIATQLFSLIDDPNEKIRKEIFAGIASQKSTLMENLLLKYIKENPDKKDPEHILACYEALGSCGSVTAFQFLKRILLSRGWNRFKSFGKALHREGAAMGLLLMDSWEAKDILLEASNNRYPVIRQAIQNAMTRFEVLRGISDG